MGRMVLARRKELLIDTDTVNQKEDLNEERLLNG